MQKVGNCAQNDSIAYKQLGCFLVLGLLASGCHYAIMILLVEGDVLLPVSASLTGYTAGGVISYHLHRNWSFNSHRAHSKAAWRFAVVSGAGFALTGMLMHLFVVMLTVPYVAAQIATSGSLFLGRFLAHRSWTFSENSQEA